MRNHIQEQKLQKNEKKRGPDQQKSNQDTQNKKKKSNQEQKIEEISPQLQDTHL